MKKILTYEGLVKMRVVYDTVTETQVLEDVRTDMNFPKVLNRNAYIVKGKPNKDGVKVMKSAFILGIVNMMKFETEAGFMNHKQSWKFVMDELSRAMNHGTEGDITKY